MSNPFRQLPAVHDVLLAPALEPLLKSQDHDRVVASIRQQIDQFRQRLAAKEAIDIPSAQQLADAVVSHLQQSRRPKLRNVINATGIVLHTNLGRAPLAEEAAKAAYEAGRGYLNLELDLETGKRSSRQNAIRDGVCRLTGAESATAVNNNAAATVLALRALCAGKEVILSRGQLIEIGGSFRIPEIMAVSGAILREVGTTNITRIEDFERAITPNTAALMEVHTSNYHISGFTETVPLPDLVALGKKHNLKVIDDVGSGALLDFARFGFEGEPLAARSIQTGADLVMFSGDKLLGGPQAGILAGRKDLIQTIEKDPLMRAFRLDKMTLAALETTLRLYLHEATALREIPCLRMLDTPLAQLKERGDDLAQRLRKLPGLMTVDVIEDFAFVGGGSLPDQRMATFAVEIIAVNVSDDDFAHQLRLGTPAVLGRLREGRLVLDMRTVFPEQIDALVEAIRSAST